MNQNQQQFLTGLMAVLIGFFAGWAITFHLWQTMPWAWWVGALVGGAVGYIIVDPYEVLRNIPLAWAKSRPVLSKAFGQLTYGTGYFIIAMAMMIFCLSIISGSWVALGKLFNYWHLPFLKGICYFVAVMFFFPATGLVIDAMDRIEQKLSKKKGVISQATRDAMPPFWPTLLSINAVGALVWAVVGMIHLVRFLRRYGREVLEVIGSGLWALVRVPFRFLGALIRLIHSNQRLIVLVSVALGVAAAFLTHNFTTGTVIGALVSAGSYTFSYKLVAQRWLKTLPLTVRA